MALGLVGDDVCDISLRAESDAHADPDPDTHGVTDPHADRDQLRPVGRQQCAESWVQFPGAARQPGLGGVNRASRTNPGGGGASASAEARLPHLVRRLWHLGPDRRARRLRRRQAQDLWRRRRLRREGRAGRQSRLLRRPEPYRHRRAAGASVGDARPDANRFQRLGRQGTVDWAFAVVHGFGKVRSSRDTGLVLRPRVIVPRSTVV